MGSAAECRKEWEWEWPVLDGSEKEQQIYSEVVRDSKSAFLQIQHNEVGGCFPFLQTIPMAYWASHGLLDIEDLGKVFMFGCFSSPRDLSRHWYIV